MKYLLIGLIVSLQLHSIAQDNAAAWNTDLKKAADIAIKEKKPLMLFYTGSDWCGVCMKLQKEVFNQPEFQVWAKKNVVLVELDYPHNHELPADLQAQNSMMQEMFGVHSYPTIIFVTPSKQQDQFYYTRIGITGYLTGGPERWIDNAKQYL